MAIRGPIPQRIANALIRFPNEGIKNVGNALARSREQENRATIGQAAQGGDFAAARDMAMRGGYLNEGMQFGNALDARKARAVASARAAAQTEESKRRFDLTHGLQKQGLDLRRQQMAQGPAATTAERNYARSQKDPAFLKYQERLKRAGAPPGPEKSYDKKVGEKFGEHFMSTQQEGAKAGRDLGQLKVMQKVLSDPNVYQGAGGDWVQSVKKAAQAAGVKVSGVESGEMAQRLSKGIALSHKGDLPGPLSNSDRQFLESLPAGLTKSAEGNRWLTELSLLNNQYLIERADAARQYAAGNNKRLDAGFFSVQAQLNAKYADQYAGLVDKLKSQERALQPTPFAGFPRAVNPQTGEELELRDGQWVKAQ